MNKIILILIVLIGASCQKEIDRKSTEHNHSTIESYYTCSMHPKVKESRPGKCPICYMNLTKVEVDKSQQSNPEVTKSEDDGLWACRDYPEVTSETEILCPLDGTPMIKAGLYKKAGEVIGKVKLRKAQLSHFRPDFFPVTQMKMTKSIRLLGSVLQSEDKESNIPARVSGRVEKVYIKSTGSFISIGDPVLDLYSPQLITAGEEYLIARKSFEQGNDPEFKDMVRQSEERLKLWGIKKNQYENWYRKGTVPRKITLYSPATGIVQKRNAIVGKYFKEGQNFFELSDLSDIWVEMDVYEQDSSLVKIGQSVKMSFTALPGEVLEGEIDFVDPILNKKSRTLKVRTTIKNSNGMLKPGMVSDATVEIVLSGRPLVIPRTAVINTGKRKVAWVKVTKDQFQAKTIRTGYESEGYVEVKGGLMEGEEVVIEGNFLLDAQAQLFGGYEDFK